ncbi:mediator complex subunit Med7 [Schizosaccharomyces japonicus yFS275]|uniref:Mediator of RNA polymerase II transcription subunit 7 n=1 Tax=Schizosaccharomyces japonicus (strain yFS275 / FY16936) TaxID=402676 RepID=B6K1C4_SCHJY|nr:mediator complex subunit Med7 [Schizosaccharomyces japonicus yFS275]EEB07745.1 mediator complex subunit Med7 [Schizosaccharomyces japonicus yFS275]
MDSPKLQLFSAFPPPPSYYKLFTEENRKKAFPETKTEDMKVDEEETDEVKQLRHVFTKPDYPKEGTYMMFGDNWQTKIVFPSLEEFGIPQFYKKLDDGAGNAIRLSEQNPLLPKVKEDEGDSAEASTAKKEPSPSDDKVKMEEDETEDKTSLSTTTAESTTTQPVIAHIADELKRLSRSLMLNFLELLGIMAKAPDQFPTKTENMRVILLNIHHLINEYRPHQARESLIVLLEKQLSSIQNNCDDLRQKNETLKSTLDKYKALDVADTEITSFVHSCTDFPPLPDTINHVNAQDEIEAQSAKTKLQRQTLAVEVMKNSAEDITSN